MSFSNYWGLEEWALHSSRQRFQRYIISFPKSRLLRRLFPQLSVLCIWSVVAVLIAHFRPGVFSTVQVPLTSLSLVSTFVAALQTLRSDKGLSRLSEGRLAMARMVLYTRDTALLINNYILQHDLRLGIKAARHLALFGWLLKCHLRDTADDANAEQLIRTLLSGGDDQQREEVDAKYVLGERKKPVAILNRLRQIMSSMSTRKLITTTEHRLIEDNIRELDAVITVGERIRSTPIPPIYAGHSTRLMMLYLFFLPLALLGASMNGISTIAVTMVVGYAMLGLDEMSHMFEQPFRFMPLHQLARVSTLDVADAFCRPPPPLDEAPIIQPQQQQQSLLNGKSSSLLVASASIANANGDGNSDSVGSYRSSYWTNVEERDFPPLPYDGRNVKNHDTIFLSSPPPPLPPLP
jgi:ion channel-forming bestrophin family protein